MKALKPWAAFVCVCLLVFSACAPAPQPQGGVDDSVRPPIAPESSLSIRPSDDGVADFLALLGDGAPNWYEQDTCYNITPVFIKEHSDFLVFKFDQSCASFLQSNGSIYPLGECFGGSGAESFALADLTGDGAYELYFTFSWGSGIHRSQVGYFDPSADAVTVFDAAFISEDVMLTLAQDGSLQVNHADILYGMEELGSFVSFDLTAGERLGTLSFEDGAVVFAQADQKKA